MNIEKIRELIKAFYPYAKQQLGFDKPVKIIYVTKAEENSVDPFGKTAYYNPQENSVTLFTLNRHPKDILRSLAHELTHHAQHCRGDFEDQEVSTEEGYAQKNPLLRKAEEEAYMQGGMLVRDWTDTLKSSDGKKERILITIMENKDKEEHKEVKQVRKRLEDEQSVTDMFEERRNKLNKKLIDKFIKPKKKEGNTE
jgi:hypothetical protein